MTLGKDPTDTWSPASEIKQSGDAAISSKTAELAAKAAEQVATAVLSNAAPPNASVAKGLLNQPLMNRASEELEMLVTAAVGKTRR